MNDVNVSALDRETKLFATIDELKAENERLRAELARIKPSWDDAPEWATHLSLRRAPWVWTRIDPELFYSDSYNMQPGEDWFLQPSDWRGYSERRPEGK